MVLLNLVEEQIRMGLDPHIASIGERGINEKPLETEALKRGFKVKQFRMLPGPNVIGMFKVLRFAQKGRFDLIHSHGYKSNVAFGLLPKRIRKLPMVSTLHGWTSTKKFSKNRIYEWLDGLSLKHIDAVVLVNRSMLSNPKLKRLKKRNLHIINNGIPVPDDRYNNVNAQKRDQTPTQFNYSAIQRSAQSPTRFIDSTNQQLDKEIIDFCSQGFAIGSIGRLSKEKGYGYLIQAVADLVKDDPEIRLIIIGEGNERLSLEKMVKEYDIEDKILIPGYMKKARKYIPYFKIFVISSLTEGLPITLLEAMSAKIPIVATKVGGIPEVLRNGKAGLLVRPGDAWELASAIKKVCLGMVKIGELLEYGYQVVLNEYSSKKMGLDYVGLYNRVALKCI